MKKYVTPRIDYIEIRPEERLAAACDDPGSCVAEGWMAPQFGVS